MVLRELICITIVYLDSDSSFRGSLRFGGPKHLRFGAVALPTQEMREADLRLDANAFLARANRSPHLVELDNHC